MMEPTLGGFICKKIKDMRKLLLILLLLPVLALGQTSNSFNNVDVRNRLRVFWKASFGSISVPTDVVSIRGNIWFDGTANRVIKMGSATPNGGKHLLIMSGYGTPVGTSIAGNVYITAPPTDTPGNVILGTDTAGTWNGGYVGIGTSSPQEQLDVHGAIRVHSVGTKLSTAALWHVLWDDADSTLYKIAWDSTGGGGLPAGVQGQLMVYDTIGVDGWDTIPIASLKWEQGASPKLRINTNTYLTDNGLRVDDVLDPEVYLNGAAGTGVDLIYMGYYNKNAAAIQRTMHNLYIGSSDTAAAKITIPITTTTEPVSILGDFTINGNTNFGGGGVSYDDYPGWLDANIDLDPGAGTNYKYTHFFYNGSANRQLSLPDESTTYLQGAVYTIVNIDATYNVRVKVQSGDYMNAGVDGYVDLTPKTSATFFNRGAGSTKGWWIIDYAAITFYP